MNSQKVQKRSIKAVFIGIIIVFLLLLYANPLFAQMKEVNDNELSQVFAQAGITYNWGDSLFNVTYDSFAISDTDHDPKNWLELKNISISGTLDEKVNTEYPWLFQYNTMDLGTLTTVDNQMRSFAQFMDATNTNPSTWDIGNLVFCSQDLGSIHFDLVNPDPSFFTISSHGVGASGMEFEYLSNWKVNNFTYTYNPTPVSPETGMLNIAGIHIAESATGSPETPSSWAFSGQFRIGDIKGGYIDVDNDPSNAAYSNPATFDVATVDGKTSIYMNLPMKGTIRAESVNFGGTDFGPMAIDGITVHHLGIKLEPGN